MSDQHRVDLFKQVMDFYLKFGLGNLIGPNHLSVRERRIRVGMMLEELGEYVTATTLEEELDALVDLVVFALGTAVRHGFTRFDEAFERVMRANMQKVRSTSSDRDEFEFLKPEEWEEPDLSDLTRQHPDVNLVDAPRDLLPPPSIELTRLHERVEQDFANEMAQREDAKFMIGYREHQLEKALERVLSTIGCRDMHLPAKIDMIAATAERALDTPKIDSTLPEARRGEDAAVMREVYTPTEQMHPVLIEAARLLLKKSEDYGDPDHSKSVYHPFGDVSYLQMLHTKLERIKNLALVKKGSPNFEPVRDSVIDLINYAAFYVAWIDEQEKEKE